MYNSKIKIRTVQRPIDGASKPDRLGAFRQPPYTIEGRPSYLRTFHIETISLKLNSNFFQMFDVKKLTQSAKIKNSPPSYYQTFVTSLL